MNTYMHALKRSRFFFSFIGLVFVSLVSALFVAEFGTVSNIITIFRQSSTLLVLSTGLTAVLLTGSMDLSVGAAAGLIGCVCAQLLKSGVSIPLAILISTLAGVLVGLFNGFLVAIVRLPSFIATYGTSWVISGLSIIVMNGAVIFGLRDDFIWLGVGYIGPIPVIVIIALLIVSAVYFILQKTTIGREIHSIGHNAEAARFSAIPVKKTIFTAFIMSSITASLAGILITARLNAADATMGDAYGLQTVAAVVVGGTSMLGGEGGVLGTIIGALLLTIIINVMNLIGISSFAQPMVVGFVILIMVLFDAFSRDRQAKSLK